MSYIERWLIISLIFAVFLGLVAQIIQEYFNHQTLITAIYAENQIEITTEIQGEESENKSQN